MKVSLTACLIMMATVSFANDKALCKVDLELADGGRVIGTMTRKRLTTLYETDKTILLPLQAIVSGSRVKEKERTFRLKLKNGDSITAELTDDAYKIQTIIGVITLKPSQIMRIRITGEPKTAPSEH